MKIYQRHYCDSRHRTFNTKARCLWPRAIWIMGEGKYAVLAWCCGSYGWMKGKKTLTVTLWETHEEAVKAMRQIDETGCGGKCSGDHEIIVIGF